LLQLVETLGIRPITQDSDLLRKHAELIADHPSTKQAYVDLILSTRHHRSLPEAVDQKLVIAASNAISILNYGALRQLFSFRFVDVRDWSGVRIPYANLNYAQMPSCNFNGSDLSHCTLFHAVLHGSTFRGADLAGARVGEYAPLRGHADEILGLVFSPDGRFLASNSADGTVRLWDMEFGDCETTLKHTYQFESISFTSSGRLLAADANNRDFTVNLWDAEFQ